MCSREPPSSITSFHGICEYSHGSYWISLRRSASTLSPESEDGEKIIITQSSLSKKVGVSILIVSCALQGRPGHKSGDHNDWDRASQADGMRSTSPGAITGALQTVARPVEVCRLTFRR